MSRQTEPKHTDDDVDNVALLSAQSIIDAEKFKNREPIVKVKIEFEEVCTTHLIFPDCTSQ